LINITTAISNDLKNSEAMKSILSATFLVLFIWACNPGNKQDKVVAQSDSASIESDSATVVSETGDLTYTIIPGQAGTYGYDILRNGKMYIHQPHIPGASGVEGFKAEGQARAAAELMITKLKDNIVPPTITEEELTEILKRN
jgi:hypothetical protein